MQEFLKQSYLVRSGIGFAKTTEQNILMMQHLQELVEMGYPCYLATSRKTMVGKVLNLPIEERLKEQQQQFPLVSCMDVI